VSPPGVELFTIGFTRTTAESFFGRLADAGVRRVLDVRLSNTSQLAGFAKAQDLPYFLDHLVGAAYEHEPLLAPTPELFEARKRRGGGWPEFARGFLALMEERRVEERLSPADFELPTALLCSEARAEECHRSLVCDHLARHWRNVRAVHL
jgi:uncharacterized protein (DUF488 family)